MPVAGSDPDFNTEKQNEEGNFGQARGNVSFLEAELELS